jgi:murein DD-endopeptidase MepM/ murein hydrolase activator NlpD
VHRAGSRFARIAVLALVLAMLPAGPASARTSRLERTRRQIRATRSLLNSARATDATISAALARYSNLLSVEIGHLHAARQNLAGINFEIDQTKSRIAKLDRERQQRAETINARARALYVMGPVNGWSAIVHSGTLKDFVGRASALQFIGTFDRSVLQDLARIKHETKASQTALSQERRRAIGIANEVADRAAAVGEIVSAKADAHSKMQAIIQSYRDEIAALEAEEGHIEQLITSRSGYYGAASRAGFAWPTLGRQINSPYGPRWGGFHPGIDIQCGTGQPAAASKDGRIISASYEGGYGNVVIIDHGGGFSSLYAHLSRIYVGVGDVVDQHRVVGACGSTGYSTGPHLHFEIRINGHHVNPRPYLP